MLAPSTTGEDLTAGLREALSSIHSSLDTLGGEGVVTRSRIDTYAADIMHSVGERVSTGDTLTAEIVVATATAMIRNLQVSVDTIGRNR